ncbi:ATP-dependent RNA helicase dbp9 [Neolecta irregularis DAH-3]|uniref:RNA helicase n=1 Tax=Neolecta irregularis (strain DAH-3) TaxID=1198029 RepID=A0A1U7LRZ1_NEOID|nr:ATP-dependent RNA helicase dbp9 [Neolecta irregularis DAH-3]|eukprot:OLL25427.1 ATP-dependent RNA helicase dbp9 [Neolecta irregularis DAH-3]
MADPLLLDGSVAFQSFALDPRLQRSIAKLNYSNPTLVQAKVIPLALAGKDIFARARTGSGKTAAYCIPIVQKILEEKEAGNVDRGVRALILVPTRELAEQAAKFLGILLAYCGKSIHSVNIASNISEQAQKFALFPKLDLTSRHLLIDLPDIVVATPSRIIPHLNSSNLSIKSTLAYLVIDEADLVLSYGYEDDVKAVAHVIPRGIQTFLMSATLTKEVEELKSLVCRSPVFLRLEEDEESAKLAQYFVKCKEDEKFLLLYVILKLKLVKGKIIIFVNNIDRSYRVKLFLEQFAIKSCVLNSELPVNSRIHVVEEFNKGIYDVIIASDEKEIAAGDDDDMEEDEIIPKVVTEAPDEDVIERTEVAESQSKNKRKKLRKSQEYSISRGIDFQNVACVLNFDLPTSTKSYVHRIGRTARAGKAGMALSFVVPREELGKHKACSFESAKKDEKVLAKIKEDQVSKKTELKPYIFNMSQVEVFRYRLEDALRAVTRSAVREARAKEIRQEILSSEKLKRHFEDNPEDLQHLRHDKPMHTARTQNHLKHVPDYLLPKGGKIAKEIGHVSFKKSSDNRIRKARKFNKRKGKGRGKRDPLKHFK